MESLSLWFTAPEKAELRTTRLLPPEKNEILVKTLFSGVSPEEFIQVIFKYF